MSKKPVARQGSLRVLDATGHTEVSTPQMQAKAMQLLEQGYAVWSVNQPDTRQPAELDTRVVKGDVLDLTKDYLALPNYTGG